MIDQSMSLYGAVELLCRVHTRDDERTGFCIEMGATPWYPWNRDHYAEAWLALLKYRDEQRAKMESKPVASAAHSASP